ncbi:MAG: GGDEF domain-containing protein [Armatimonadetes bacterium]|nr:GGDEF domain-containing protein [Armatimonadota bacterium]
MITVADIMVKNPLVISPELSVGRAADIMEKFKIGGLPVVDGGFVVGIITSRDVRKSHPNRLVADAMTKDVLTVPPQYSLWEAKEFIEKHGLERVVVAQEGKLLGVVTKALFLMEFGKRIDALTGLYRSEYLHYAALKLLRNGQEIAVIFIDLDNFGVIDKELGHVSGDLILQRVAKLFKEVVREETDYLCRYAGDEFAVVTARPLKEAKTLCLELLTSLTEERWPGGVKLSASAGIAGGRRSQARKGAERYTINDLINLASLGSTKAKKENTQLVVVGQVEITEIR